MVAAIRQVVKVRPGGIVQVRSSRLKAGSQAEVIVLLPQSPKRSKNHTGKSNGAPAKRASGHPIARMTKQVRGDVAQANRMRRAIRAGQEQLIPWDQVKRDLGLE